MGKTYLMKKAQGATEYLIVLAIVIIIALIVVVALGGIPGIGTGAQKRASESFWQTADIAIPSYALTASDDNLALDVRNNLKDSISSLDVTVNSKTATCGQTSLSAGQETNCNITDITTCDAGDAFSFDVNIEYIHDKSGAEYTYTGEGHNLEGKCAT